MNGKRKNGYRKVDFLIIIIAMIVICSCSVKSGQDAEKLPGVDIPLAEMNSMIEVVSYPGMEEIHKIGESLCFVILNRSKETYDFDQDFGIKVFIKQGEDWEPIENNVDYPQENNVLKPKDVNPNGLDFFAYPNIKEMKIPIIVRIVIIGHVMDKPSEKVGAYIDVQYNP